MRGDLLALGAVGALTLVGATQRGARARKRKITAAAVNEQLWNTYGDGQLRRFDELPLTYQKALAFESLDFDWYGDLEATERRYEHGLESQSDFGDLKGGVRFKAFRVPSDAMTSAIWSIPGDLQANHDDWDSYHDWYLGTLRKQELKKRREDWPVILHDHPTYDELLWDGWHRLHTYLKLKRKDIPCLLPVYP